MREIVSEIVPNGLAALPYFILMGLCAFMRCGGTTSKEFRGETANKLLNLRISGVTGGS